MASDTRQCLETSHPESFGALPEAVRLWNQTRTSYPRESAIAQLFEEAAAAHPQAIAVVFGAERLTYAELNARANRLARRLRAIGVRDEVMVGCCLERSVEMIVAFLAILKAGGAYVPFDPSYPKERFEFMLEDARTPVMLAQRKFAHVVPANSAVQVLFEDEFGGAAGESDDVNLAPAAGPTSLAYVMYTSGSTGRPKGVMVENRAIARLVRHTNFCRFGSEETFLLFAPVSFDASTLEIWGPLLNGGKLVVMPPQASSLEDLGRTIREHDVTTLWLTSGLFNLMVEQGLEDLVPVRQMLAGGDVLSARHVRAVLDRFPGCTVINGYGPTENTTFTCCHAMRAGEIIPDSVPIGKPISNTRVYILDERMQPVAPGVAGELWAAGDGVARGYLNNAEETAAKFLADPFAAEDACRMYRTGDLARWNGDGTVEFLGRMDGQVKILGHRIEPGEIEAVLRMHPEIAQVCVAPSADASGSKRLIAYCVPAGQPGPSPADLRKFLAGKLPQYMIPALFVSLAALPLSPNGKVDRAVLPAPAPGAADHDAAEAPATQLEKTLAALWTRILRVERLGLDDNFFDLGGDSLMIVAVHSNLQKTLDMEIPVTDLFEFTTVRTLARHLAGGKPAPPSLTEVRLQAQKQREAFARQRERRAGAQ
ncbi:MAG TPA: non-ribosomal peptide synthetase [Candidatus Acidoferrales bacterium]|nr:non-ribosomal peptide synthetase [Candidatus Acidoferrales bacterium]